jgi:hypothetical protein
MKFLLTQDALNVTINGLPYSISKDYPNFAKIRDAVVSGQSPAAIFALIDENARAAKRLIESSMRAQNLTGRLTYDEGLIYFDGTAIANYAVDTLLRFLHMGHNAAALARFVEKQQTNPDAIVHEHLYAFLEFGKIPLTQDGDFLVYKAVRPNYRDIRSGTFDNSVGRVCAIPREQVDPNRAQTCSYGLHVCSFAYLPHFADAQGHVMLCKVDPYNVVAIPNDYNNTKMRVCRYEVVGEVTEYYRKGEDILAKERLMGIQFFVRDSSGAPVDECYTLEEAKNICNEGEGWKVVDLQGRELYQSA